MYPPKLPVVRNDEIENSPYKRDIFNRLLSGWSPGRISKHLKEYTGAFVSVEAIEALREGMEPLEALDESLLASMQKFIDVEIDPELEMARTLVLQRSRLEASMVLDDAVSIDSKSTGTEIGRYWKMLREFVEARAEMKARPIVVIAPRNEKLPTLRRLVEGPVVDGEVIEAD